MAFEGINVNAAASSGGKAGVVSYVSSADAVATIRGDAYWNQAAYNAMERRDQRAYEALRDFVEAQQAQTGANGGVMFLAIGNNGGGSPRRLTVQGGFLQVENAT